MMNRVLLLGILSAIFSCAAPTIGGDLEVVLRAPLNYENPEKDAAWLVYVEPSTFAIDDSGRIYLRDFHKEKVLIYSDGIVVDSIGFGARDFFLESGAGGDHGRGG